MNPTVWFEGSLLRKIEAVIDFSFIHDRVAGLYCPDNGRPPLDPTLMFKALFIGYLLGVRSERQLVREIEVTSPTAGFWGEADRSGVRRSTLSQNRRRRYNDTTVAQDIFDRRQGGKTAGMHVIYPPNSQGAADQKLSGQRRAA